MKTYAHSIKDADKSQWQTLKDHLESTASIAERFAARINAETFGKAIGLLHDIGKYSVEFQKRLEGMPLKVDHSTAGAQEAVKIYGKALGRILAYIIAGHHSGLPDVGSKADDSSLDARLLKKALPEYSVYKKEITTLPPGNSFRFPLCPQRDYYGFCLQMFIRFLYSCLVDADFLDTEKALDTAASRIRSGYPSLKELLDKLDAFLENKCKTSEVTYVNQQRAEILKNCREKALHAPGLFTLTVPTGGGKTLSSLAFALRHAVIHNMERVIYVIPFTSIIEQNASVFRNVLGDNCVLEHHSNFAYPDENSEDWSEAVQKLKLSVENWDAPIIVTTNVQFFESLFACKSSRCRKLHNIAGSVVIMDEAQMLPTAFLKPCLAAISELASNYGTSIVLCTATQPALDGLFPLELKPVEIIPQPKKLYKAFKRVSVSNIGQITNEQLANALLEHNQALCIVNTRKHARELFEMMNGQQGTYHLSARMCPAHRTSKLKAVKDTLSEAKTCRVVSTQIIEAGVDVDFPAVYRSSAGIDSIAQAAGRCNREGKMKKGDVYIFRPEKQGLPSGWFSRTASITDMVLRKCDDPLSLDSVRQYFTILYNIEGQGLDEKNIMKRIKEDEKNLSFPFRSIAEDFRLIDRDTLPVIIPWDDECEKLMEEAAWNPYPFSLARRFQPYIVQVYPNEFIELVRARALKTVAGTFHFLVDSSLYCEETGLQPLSDAQTTGEVLIF